MLAGPALAAAQRVVPDAVVHTAAGLSITAGATVPALWSRPDVGATYRISAYGVWGAASAALFVLELVRHPRQRRLLLGLVLFSGLNLLGSLSQGASTMLDAVAAWGPLALSASLCLMPIVIESLGGTAETAAETDRARARRDRAAWCGRQLGSGRCAVPTFR